MAVLRYIVPALAVATGALAQSSCGSASSTTTIQSSGDATALASCSTYSGSIAIATSATEITLSGIQSITGDLVANNATSMTSFSAPNLQEIQGEFHLESLTVLSTLSFPELTNVDTIFWTALPALQALAFTTGVQEVKMLEITNTELGSLDGINLEVIDTFTVENNPYLTEINMQLGNVTTALGINANGKNLQVEFPNLMWAYNISIRDASEVLIPSLGSVNGSLGFYSDDFTSLSAPNLTNVGGSLTFASCNSLTNISMPELTTVGGAFQLANNSALETIDGFSSLKTVGGALDFYGAFTNVSLPALSDVRGAFNMRSSGNLDSVCSYFNGLSGQNNVIKGKYYCKGQTTPNSAGSPTTSSSSTSSTSSAASPMLIPSLTGVLGVVAALFGLL